MKKYYRGSRVANIKSITRKVYLKVLRVNTKIILIYDILILKIKKGKTDTNSPNQPRQFQCAYISLEFWLNKIQLLF